MNQEQAKVKLQGQIAAEQEKLLGECRDQLQDSKRIQAEQDKRAQEYEKVIMSLKNENERHKLKKDTETKNNLDPIEIVEKDPWRIIEFYKQKEDNLLEKEIELTVKEIKLKQEQKKTERREKNTAKKEVKIRETRRELVKANNVITKMNKEKSDKEMDIVNHFRKNHRRYKFRTKV